MKEYIEENRNVNSCISKEEIAKIQYTGDLESDGKPHYFTILKIAGRYLRDYLETHNIEYKLLDGDMLEIPDGVRQYGLWTDSDRKFYKHVQCFVTEIPCRKLRDLTNFLIKIDSGAEIR